MDLLNIDYIDLEKINDAKVKGNIISFEIFSFYYTNGKYPRLPRKTSTNYNLRVDTKYCFFHAFKKIKRVADNSRYRVKMIVGITSTKKIWIDDMMIGRLMN